MSHARLAPTFMLAFALCAVACKPDVFSSGNDGRALSVSRTQGFQSLDRTSSGPLEIISSKTEASSCTGSYRVHFTVRNTGTKPVFLDAGAVKAALDGDVSNSAVKLHGAPKSYSGMAFAPDPNADGVFLQGGVVLFPKDPTQLAKVSDARDPRKVINEDVCFEGARLELRFRPDQIAAGAAGEKKSQARVDSMATFEVYLELSHYHYVWGYFDPLFGTRKLTLTLGDDTVSETFSLSQASNGNQPVLIKLDPKVPEERKGKHPTFCPDGCLRLHVDQAKDPNQVNDAFHFPEVLAHYGSRFRLSFHYFMDKQSDGNFSAAVYARRGYVIDAKTSSDLTAFTQPLWRAEFLKRDENAADSGLFTMREDANRVRIEFQILGATRADVYIKDVQFATADAGRGP